MGKPSVSIIIRTKNEERWIGACLSAVFSQTYRDFEVILVDNESTDRTVQKARQFNLAQIVTCQDYRPGKALNLGILSSRGDRIVCLSGHCVPVNDQWLATLVRNLDEESVAAAYGRQEPLAFTSDSDKRDLAIAFGLDRRVQLKDSFFHNANSVIRRDLWESVPFDELVTNIEDRVWAKEILTRGWKIIYDPDASVYHHHGIHHNGNAERCANVVRILESVCRDLAPDPLPLHLERLDVLAVVPVRGPIQYLNEVPLIAHTIERAKRSRFIRRVIVATDDPALAALAISLGAEAPFLRPAELSRDFVDIEQVLRYSLQQVEEMGAHPDLLVSLEVTFPFRPAGMLDDMIVQLVRSGLDSILVGRKESQSIWKQEGGEFKRVDIGHVPRKYKEPIYVGCKGLGCVTHPALLREGRLLGDRLAIYELQNALSFLEVREPRDFDLAGKLIDPWLNEQDARPCEEELQQR